MFGKDINSKGKDENRFYRVWIVWEKNNAEALLR